MALNAYRYRFYGGDSGAEQAFLLSMYAKGYTAATLMRVTDQTVTQGAVPLNWATGTYTRTPMGTSGVATASATVSRSFATGIYVPYGKSIDRVAIECTTVGGAGSVMRIGLYTDSNGSPGTLINDAGTVDTAVGTGMKELTVAWSNLTGGLYWIVTVAQVGTAPTVRTASAAFTSIAPYRATTVSNTPDSWQVYGANITGALPASYGSVTGTTTGPLVVVRAA